MTNRRCWNEEYINAPFQHQAVSLFEIHYTEKQTFKHENKTKAMPAPQVSDTLFHVKRTITDYHEDKSGATRMTDVLGTFTDLAAAKAAAHSALASEGYLKDDFELYEAKVETDPEEWKHGDGVLVFAKAPAGQEFEVRLDTKPNVFGLKGNEAGEVEGHLHYGMYQIFG